MGPVRIVCARRAARRYSLVLEIGKVLHGSSPGVEILSILGILYSGNEGGLVFAEGIEIDVGKPRMVSDLLSTTAKLVVRVCTETLCRVEAH
jgi:hypothetical protein